MRLLSRTIFPAVLSVVLGSSVVADEQQTKDTENTTATQKPVAEAAQVSASSEFADALLAINTLSGEFVQRVLDNEGEELQVTTGEFKIKRPGYFFWKVAPPYEQLVIGTPESLKVYDPDLEQLSVHNQSSLAGTPASLISGDVDAIAQDYHVSKKSEKAAETYELKQKDSELSAFESLAFTFAKKDKTLALTKMVFTDKLGQRTEVSMTKTRMNKAITADNFTFTAPPGTDVIVDG